MAAAELRAALLAGACMLGSTGMSAPGHGAPLVAAPLPPARPTFPGDSARGDTKPTQEMAPPPAAPTVAVGVPDATCMAWFAALPAHRVRKAPANDTATAPTKSGVGAGLSQDTCTVVDPVVIEALSVSTPDGATEIAFVPPPIVSCAFAKTFAEWLDTSLQPLARGSFGQNLTALRVGGGHECRRRNRQANTPVSEHSTGRALDIFAFQVGEAKEGLVSVETPSGMVQSRFLSAVRSSACGAFSTTLGPGSDAAHANHLHIDIQERRTASTRFCQ